MSLSVLNVVFIRLHSCGACCTYLWHLVSLRTTPTLCFRTAISKIKLTLATLNTSLCTSGSLKHSWGFPRYLDCFTSHVCAEPVGVWNRLPVTQIYFWKSWRHSGDFLVSSRNYSPESQGRCIKYECKTFRATYVENICAVLNKTTSSS